MKRIYILNLKYKRGNITIAEEISVFNTRELAEAALREVKKSNDVEFASEIFESTLYESSEEVPILQSTIPQKLLYCNLGVRYYEDGIVDGKEDISFEVQKEEVKPHVPCVQHFEPDEGDDYWRWCPIIDVEQGKIINWEPGVSADVHYKVCDDCQIEYKFGDKLICNNDGYWYCPEFLCPQGEGYGDYVIMKINGEGYISRWSKYDVDVWCSDQLENKED